MAPIRENQKDEAERIYAAIFKASLPPVIKERFHQAAQCLVEGFSAEERQEYKKALEKISDLEALELVARHKVKIPLLVSRFRIMVHLAETFPENQNIFVSKDHHRFCGFLSLCIGGLRTLMKWIRGWLLLRRLGDV